MSIFKNEMAVLKCCLSTSNFSLFTKQINTFFNKLLSDSHIPVIMLVAKKTKLEDCALTQQLSQGGTDPAAHGLRCERRKHALPAESTRKKSTNAPITNLEEQIAARQREASPRKKRAFISKGSRKKKKDFSELLHTLCLTGSSGTGRVEGGQVTSKEDEWKRDKVECMALILQRLDQKLLQKWYRKEF